MIYVLNKDGKPLMPTNRYGRVRHLLKDNRAKVVKKCPFTIELLYDSTNYTQTISLGIDSGSKHIGLSATIQTKELYSADVELRTDIVDLISTRRQNYNNKECFIFGRRSTGYFDLRTLDNTHVHKSASWKKFKLIEMRKNYLIERRLALLPPPKGSGFPHLD